MQSDLEALLILQERDKDVAAAESLLRALDPEVAALDAELLRVEAELAAARGRIEEAGNRRLELEGKIESYRVMQERRKQRLEWVRGAKEASTLMAELDLARSVLAKEEAEWIRSADKVQEAERRAADAERLVQETRDGQAARREELAALRAEHEDKVKEALASRNAAATSVSRPLLGRYERIRRGKAPFALYPLHHDACGHCFTAIPMHRRQDVLNGTAVETCEACGVMVYAVRA